MLRAEAAGLRVILHCFSMAERIEECLAHDGLVDLVRRQRHLPEGGAAARWPRCGCPPSGCWSRPTRRTCRRRPVRGKPNQPANVVHTAQALAVERRVAYEELEAAVERIAAAVFGW